MIARKKTNKKTKEAFRKTVEWRNFRTLMRKEQKGKDAITLQPLRQGWNLHHKRMGIDTYTDITNHDDFVCLNKSTHELLHHLWRYYAKDPSVLERLKQLLEEMRLKN